MGRHVRRKDPDGGSCSRRGHSAAATESAAPAPHRGNVSRRPHATVGSRCRFSATHSSRSRLPPARWIERRAQFADRCRQRIGEIFVFAAPETVARHHDLAAEVLLAIIERGERFTFACAQYARQQRTAEATQFIANSRPIDLFEIVHAPILGQRGSRAFRSLRKRKVRSVFALRTLYTSPCGKRLTYSGCPEECPSRCQWRFRPCP